MRVKWLIENAVVCFWAGSFIVLAALALESQLYWMFAIFAAFVVYFGIVQKFILRK